jgi:hypothetical protein
MHILNEETVSGRERVKIRSLLDARLLVASSSGEQYVFERAGSEVNVLKEDVNTLLEKRHGGCCGGSPYPLFELVVEA